MSSREGLKEQPMANYLREAIQAIINRWDDDNNQYRGRVMIMQLKAALAAEPPASQLGVSEDRVRELAERIVVEWYEEMSWEKYKSGGYSKEFTEQVKHDLRNLPELLISVLASAETQPIVKDGLKAALIKRAVKLTISVAAAIVEGCPAAKNPYHASNGVREAMAAIRALDIAAIAAKVERGQ